MYTIYLFIKNFYAYIDVYHLFIIIDIYYIISIWYSSKVFAMANAAGRLRSNESECRKGLFGLDGSTTGWYHNLY